MEMPQEVKLAWSKYWFPLKRTSKKEIEECAYVIARWFVGLDEESQSDFLQQASVLLADQPEHLQCLVLTFIEQGFIKLGTKTIEDLQQVKAYYTHSDIKAAVDYIIKEIG